MKILAVRGRNLASLVDLDLSLDAGPLARAGLFAITGPTGAGKSTVLDAMCLALFNTTPRLAQAGRTAIAELKASDPRSLLRRGAVEGWAECEFLGGDGAPYKARWQVRRAHGKADRALQEPRLTLTDMRGQLTLGNTNTEVLAETRRRLGLDFDQFRRSALLAQGDFAAFLAAEPDVRARLLERMTGAEIYTALSLRAFSRTGEEAQALAVLEGAAAQRTTLAAEERTALERSIRELSDAHAQVAGKLERLAERARWLATFERLQARLVESQRAHAEAEASYAQHAEEAVLLRRIEAVQQHRPQLDRLERLEREAAELVRRCTLATEQHQQAVFDLGAAQDAAVTVRQAWEQARALRDALVPRWEGAQRLDSLIDDKDVACARARAAVAAAARRVASARTTYEATDHSCEGARTRQAAAKRAVAAGAVSSELAAGWTSWGGVLEDLALVFARAGAAKERKQHLTAQIAAAEEARAQAQARHLAALRESNERTIEGAEAEERAAVERLSTLERIARLDDVGRELGAASEKNARGLAELSLEIDETMAAAQAAAAAARELAERLELDVRALRLFHAQRDLAAHRAQLVDGEPCPLCGATEHPLAGDVAEQTVADLERRVAEQRKRASDLTAQEAHAWAAGDRARKEQRRQIEERDALARRTSEWRGRCDTERAALPEPIRRALRETAVATLIAEARGELARAQEQRAASVRALRAHQALTEHERTLGQLGGESELATRALVDLAAQHERLRARLADVLRGVPGWEAELEAAGSGFIDRCRQAVQAHHEARAAAARSDAEVARLEVELQAAAGQVDSEQRLAAQLGDALEALTQERNRLAGERAALLPGTVAESRRDVDESLTAADSARQEADKRVASLERLVIERAAQVAALKGQLDTSRREAELAAAGLGATLLELGLSRVELAALLGHDPTWVSEAREALSARRDAVAAAEAACAERRAALSDHTAQRPDEIGLETLETAVLESQLDALGQQLEQRRFSLRSDDEARAAVDALRPRIEEQRQRWQRWSRLNEVIGAHDGKPFRLFAQRVTLDALLLDANRQLARLAPRYRLERVPGTNMDLSIIDQDMGDDRRSVNSLSGGESFLVSLALALALSSFASRDTRIETLFIDEGFGALDAHTLDVALAALDALQATGCQVGVISHVTALTERMGARVELVRRAGGMSTLELR